MTKDRVYAFTRKLQGTVKRARQLEASLDDGDGYKVLLQDTNPAKALELAGQLVQGRKQLEQYVASVNGVTRRDGLERADELLADLAAALEQAENCYAEWRATKQGYELAVLGGEFEENTEGRMRANTQLDVLQRRYELAVEVASNLVPSPGVVQL